MKYIVHRRFKKTSLCGNVNLPFGTECEKVGETIYYNGKPLVFATSENAHQYFARDDDGNGIERGRLTQKILAALCAVDIKQPQLTDKQLARVREHEKLRKQAWELIWDDESLLKFKKTEHADYWLWNHDFFNADIEDLKYILGKIEEAKRVRTNQRK